MSRSTGPNVATPRAWNGLSACAAASQLAIRGSVSSGDRVGNAWRLTTRSGVPSAMATTQVVPPPSTPAQRFGRDRPDDETISDDSSAVGSDATDMPAVQRPSATDHWSIADNSRRCRFPRVLPQKPKFFDRTISRESLVSGHTRAHWTLVTATFARGRKRPRGRARAARQRGLARTLCRRSGWDFRRALDLPQLGQDTRHGDVQTLQVRTRPSTFSPPVSSAAPSRPSRGARRVHRGVGTFPFHRHPVSCGQF